MRLRRCAVLLASLAIGCPSPKSGTPVARDSEPAYIDPPRVYLDGSVAKVGLLARQFLIGAAPPNEVFAYHCYLLFADRSNETAAARRGAAVGYLRLLSDVAVARAQTKIDRRQMAVLFAPLVDRRVAERLLKEPDVRVFLENYNYDRARLLFVSLAQAGVNVPRVAIVGNRQPLEGKNATPGDVTIADLFLSDDAQIERRLMKLKDDLETNRISELSRSGEPLVFRLLREFFESVGAVGAALGDLKGS